MSCCAAATSPRRAAPKARAHQVMASAAGPALGRGFRAAAPAQFWRSIVKRAGMAASAYSAIKPAGLVHHAASFAFLSGLQIRIDKIIHGVQALIPDTFHVGFDFIFAGGSCRGK